jgi:hypothetical protein
VDDGFNLMIHHRVSQRPDIQQIGFDQHRRRNNSIPVPL